MTDTLKERVQPSVILGTCLLVALSIVAVATTEAMPVASETGSAIHIAPGPNLEPAPRPQKIRRSTRRSRAS